MPHFMFNESTRPEDHVDDKRDFRQHRIWECKFNKVHFVQDNNPYGFWTIHLDAGIPPKGLRGYFTSIDDAELAAMTHYITPKKEEIRKRIT